MFKPGIWSDGHRYHFVRRWWMTLTCPAPCCQITDEDWYRRYARCQARAHMDHCLPRYEALGLQYGTEEENRRARVCLFIRNADFADDDRCCAVKRSGGIVAGQSNPPRWWWTGWLNSTKRPYEVGIETTHSVGGAMEPGMVTLVVIVSLVALLMTALLLAL